tara:strand:+ start:1832 stop:2560 length:729 start_codon:yes stop_codon:yes gene_type:complete
MKIIIPFFSTFLCILVFSCSDSISLEERLAVQLENDGVLQQGSIEVTPVKYKKEYALQELSLESEEVKEAKHKLNLQFKETLPKGYEIHYTVNNGPFIISKTAKIELEMLEGNNVVLAFLSLANGLRIPNEKAVFLKNYVLGGEQQSDITETGIHLFHHLSNYADSSGLFLDFYAKNVAEGSNYFARVITDGNQFNLSLHKAFQLDGLTKGYHDIRIQLVDGSGNVVDGPFNDTGVISIKVE